MKVYYNTIDDVISAGITDGLIYINDLHSFFYLNNGNLYLKYNKHDISSIFSLILVAILIWSSSCFVSNLDRTTYHKSESSFFITIFKNQY